MTRTEIERLLGDKAERDMAFAHHTEDRDDEYRRWLDDVATDAYYEQLEAAFNTQPRHPEYDPDDRSHLDERLFGWREEERFEQALWSADRRCA